MSAVVSYEAHPAANLFPMLSDMELDRLAADIRDNGLLDPIVLYTGLILDGRNRYAACQRVSVEPRFIEYDGESPVRYVLSKNLLRRQLTTSQRAAIAAESVPMLRDEAKKRQLSKLKHVGETIVSSTSNERGRALEIAAREVGVSATTVWEAEQVKNADPEAFERVKSGETVVHQAYKKVTEAKKEKLPADERSRQISDLAAQGFRASQIADEIGVGEEHVRELARRNDIALPDALVGKTRKIDVNRIIGETVIGAQGLVSGLELVDSRLDQIDQAQVDSWAESLKESIAALNRLMRLLRRRS